MFEKIALEIFKILLHKWQQVTISFIAGSLTVFVFFSVKNAIRSDHQFKQKISSELNYLKDSAITHSELGKMNKSIQFSIDTSFRTVNGNLEIIKKQELITRNVLSKHIENSSINSQQKLKELKELWMHSYNFSDNDFTGSSSPEDENYETDSSFSLYKKNDNLIIKVKKNEIEKSFQAPY